MFAAGISNGHVTAADWLFLIAAILFLIAAVLSAVGDSLGPKGNPMVFVSAGLVAVAIGWLVL